MSLTTRDGELHVDVETWASLIGRPTPTDALATARAVPGGEQALAAVAHPMAVVQLQTATPNGVRTHEVWLGEDAAAVLVHTAEGPERHLVPLPHDHVSAALARLTGLGPRDRVDPGVERRAREVAESELEAWFADDVDVRRAALAPFGADRAWRLMADAVGSSEEPIVLVAADGVAGGCWAVERTDDGFVAVPVSPTLTFRRLASVMPLLGQDLEASASR